MDLEFNGKFLKNEIYNGKKKKAEFLNKKLETCSIGSPLNFHKTKNSVTIVGSP
jgi:hypothetical protein